MRVLDLAERILATMEEDGAVPSRPEEDAAAARERLAALRLGTASSPDRPGR